MIFSSLPFIFWFLPIVFLFNLLIQKRYSNYFLALASLFFYFWGETKYTYIFILSVLINYGFGLLINKYSCSKYIKYIFGLGIVVNVLLLGYYKYFNFLIDNINNLSSITSFKPIDNPSIHLPIGISFFTFEAIAYLYDLYKQKSKVIKNPIDLLLYMGIFPHLIAGPVIRYVDLQEQLKNRNINLDDVCYGIKRFILGLGKKVILANGIGQIADNVFNNSTQFQGSNIFWIGLIAYALQLYFDFSGYSDMAIGLGKLFGFTFIENFNYPYASQSVQEFWRRWNISLGIWFKNYVYIPMGGSKVGMARNLFNLLVVFILTGFWHGAGTNFIIWGLYSGLFIVLEKLFISRLFNYLGPVFGKIVSHIYLIFVILISWVFFRAESTSKALVYLGKLFTTTYQDTSLILTKESETLLVISLLLAFPFIRNILIKEQETNYLQPIFNIMYLIIFIVSISLITTSTYNPFIYFRF